MFSANQLVKLAQYSQLESERLVLKPLSLIDLDDYYEYTSDEEVLKYDYAPYCSIEDCLEGLVVWHLSSPLGKYGLFLKSSGKLIGNVSLKSDKKDCVTIGYTLNQKFWRQGYASEAVDVLINFAFTELGAKIILAKVNAKNLASISLLKKFNFKLTHSQENVLHYRGYSFTELSFELTI